MRTGLLWFDNNEERDLTTKIERAAKHYEAKYGVRPTLCYVHPSALLLHNPRCVGIAVKGTNLVLPHHLWLGIPKNEDGS